MTGLLAAACQTIDSRNSRSLFAIQLAFEAKELEFLKKGVRVRRLKQALDEALKWVVKAVDLCKVLCFQYATPLWEKDKTKEGIMLCRNSLRR